MLWRSKSNKNRTAHAGVEPAGDSGQQLDTAKPAPQAVYCFTVIPPSRHRCKKPYRHEKNEQYHYFFLR